MTPALSMYSCRLSILWKVANLFPGGHLPMKEKRSVERSSGPMAVLEAKSDLIISGDRYCYGQL